MGHRIQAFFTCCACFVLVSGGCASDDDESKPSSDRSASSEKATTYLGLQKPADGFQIRSVGAEILAGEDLELCEVGRLPGDADAKYVAKSFELGNETGSHHLIVSAAVPGSPAEAKIMEVGVGNKVPCLSAENAFGTEAFVSVAGSQQPYVEVVMPEGVGRQFSGGQWIVFDYHYLNTGEEPIQARSAVNFHLTDAESIKQIAKGFSFSNYTMATPPGAQGYVTGECHFNADVVVADLTRHTHRWGTDFTVWFSGGARDGEEIWTSHDWQHDTFYKFDAPFVMKAGEGFRVRCDYDNDTTRTLHFGTSATDEMCILFGTIWETEDSPFMNQNCVIVWKDEDGIGHPANEAGGFPAPEQADVALCMSGSPDDACSRCRCEACAAPAIQCALDADCQAITDCYSACPAGEDCTARCRDATDTHSSGLGALQQRSSCFQSRCADECM